MILEKKLFEALKSMPNDKCLGNDGLTKEFFQTFWSKVKNHFYYVFYTLLVKRNSLSRKYKQFWINWKKRQR